MKFGELYDGLDPEGQPFIDPNRKTIEDTEERLRVCAFLMSGQLVLRSLDWDGDCFDRENGVRLEIAYLSDGEFMWPLSLSYYALIYGVAPDEAFYEHIRENEYRCAPTEVLFSDIEALLKSRSAATA